MNQMILLLLILNSLIFISMNHPMSMGLILLIQTLLINMLTGLLTKTFWFSYILFIIFIGGMLVLFIYMASLSSNEKFNFSFHNLIIYLILMMMSYLFISKLFLYNFNNESIEMNNLLLMMKENNLITSKMYEIPNNWTMIFMINYLLFNLIIIVKITNYFKGPLRILN